MGIPTNRHTIFGVCFWVCFWCPRSILLHDNLSRVGQALCLELFPYIVDEAIKQKHVRSSVGAANGTLPLISHRCIAFARARPQKHIKVEAVIVRTRLASHRYVAHFCLAKGIA